MDRLGAVGDQAEGHRQHGAVGHQPAHHVVVGGQPAALGPDLPVGQVADDRRDPAVPQRVDLAAVDPGESRAAPGRPGRRRWRRDSGRADRRRRPRRGCAMCIMIRSLSIGEFLDLDPLAGAGRLDRRGGRCRRRRSAGRGLHHRHQPLFLGRDLAEPLAGSRRAGPSSDPAPCAAAASRWPWPTAPAGAPAAVRVRRESTSAPIVRIPWTPLRSRPTVMPSLAVAGLARPVSVPRNVRPADRACASAAQFSP